MLTDTRNCQTIYACLLTQRSTLYSPSHTHLLSSYIGQRCSGILSKTPSIQWRDRAGFWPASILAPASARFMPPGEHKCLHMNFVFILSFYRRICKPPEYIICVCKFLSHGNNRFDVFTDNLYYSNVGYVDLPFQCLQNLQLYSCICSLFPAFFLFRASYFFFPGIYYGN